MKRVGILVNSIGFGGNERSAVNIANAIRERFSVSVITQEDCGNHYGYEGRVFNLNTPCAKTIIGKALNSLRRIIRLKRIIQKEQIDTLLIILPVSNPINYLSYRCKKIVSCRDCGDLLRRTDKYVRMTKCSDLMICNSLEQVGILKNAAPGEAEKITYIYNILDIDKIERLKNERLDAPTRAFMEGTQCIVCTGRFAPAKGLNNLLKAFSILVKNYDNVKLILVGDGELRGKIQALIEDLHLNEKVMLPGFQDNPFKYIANADLFVLSSFYEGFPNVLVEAMACGTPVIAADCPSGPAEILKGNTEHGCEIKEFGGLIPAFDEKSSSWDANDINDNHVLFANLMEKLLTDKQKASALADSAMIRVKDFTAEKIKDDWESIL